MSTKPAPRDFYLTRRRYPGTTFTWIHIILPDGRNYEDSEPVQKIVPSRKDIAESRAKAIAWALANPVTTAQENTTP